VVARHEHPDALLTVDVLRELRVLLTELEQDPEVRVFVMTGSAPGSYMIALDPAQGVEMSSRIPPVPAGLAAPVVRGLARWMRRIPALAKMLDWTPPLRGAYLDQLLIFDILEHSSLVTIAAISGDCFGGGLELSLGFDFRFVADDPDIVIAQPEILAGLVPGFGATERLAKVLGPAKALEVMLLAEPMSPQEAERAGLVHRVIEGDFDSGVLEIAERLANRSPVAVGGIKRAMQHGDELFEVLRAWRSTDTQRGLAAFRGMLDGQRAMSKDKRRPSRELLAKLDAGLVQWGQV